MSIIKTNSSNSSMEKLAKFALSYLDIIKSVSQMGTYNDEPKIFTYSAEYTKKGESKSDFSSGSSFDQKQALIKTLGEAIERYCLDMVDNKQLLIATISELKTRFLDPKNIPSFSKIQLSQKVFASFAYSDSTKFRWIEGYSLREKVNVLIPAQLVFTNYQHLDKEPYIRFPISTGAAAHTSLEQAIYTGICEVVERDSFMIYYLNMMSPTRIDIRAIKNKEFQTILEILDRYKFEVHIFDITTDLEIPVFAAILLDRTCNGPSISVGLKAGFNEMRSVIGAIEEALMTRTCIRDKFIYEKQDFKLSKKIKSFDEREYFWFKPEMIKHLDFMLTSKKKRKIELSDKNETEYFTQALRLLQKTNLDTYYIDITQKEIKNNGFIVVKVFIPKLYPVYFDEEYPYLGIDRLYDTPMKLGQAKKIMSELNTIPHPFL